MNSYLKSTILFTFAFLMASNVYSQVDSTIINSNNISLSIGLGNYSIIDEFISDERYQGTVTNYEFTWFKNHGNYLFELNLEYQTGSDIRNYNVSSSNQEFVLQNSYLFPIGKSTFFSRNLFWYLGPEVEFYFHYSKINIASGGVNAHSRATLFSTGIKSNVFYPISKRILINAYIQTTIVSYGTKYASERTTPKVLTLFSGIRTQVQLNVIYQVKKIISFSFGYKFKMVRISKWDYFLSGNSNFLFSTIIHF